MIEICWSFHCTGWKDRRKDVNRGRADFIRVPGINATKLRVIGRILQLADDLEFAKRFARCNFDRLATLNVIREMGRDICEKLIDHRR